MPLAACPKCATNLKVPDGATAAVRCPKCQTVFKPKPPAQPAFEVVDDTAAPPKPARPASKPAAKPAAEPEFEVVDEPAPKKKVVARAEVDDDDDRPRSKKRRDDDDDPPRKKKRRDDDDDDDDRPRGKNRRDDDDDDDDDEDRPRKKKKRGRDVDDYDYSPPGKGSKFGLGRVGLLLVIISLGLYLGSIALHILFLLIALIGGVIPNGLSLLTGIMGMANWVVAIVGLGFCIAGPAKSRGLAIAALSTAAVHLILAFIVVNDSDSAGYSMNMVPEMSMYNRADTIMRLNKDYQKEMEKNPNSSRAKELRDDIKSYQDDYKDESGFDDRRGRSTSKMRWGDLNTQLPYVDQLIGILSYRSSGFSKYLLGMFCGLAEVARFILIALLIGSMAGAAKHYRAQNKAKIGWIVGASATGACWLIFLLVMVILDSYASDLKKGFTGGSSSPPPSITPGMDFQKQQADWFKQMQADAEKQVEKIRSSGKAMMRWGGVGELLVFLVHGGMLVLPGLAAMQVYGASAPRRDR